MSWRVGYKASPSTPVEDMAVDTRTSWDAVETVRSDRAADGGKVIYVKAGE